MTDAIKHQTDIDMVGNEIKQHGMHVQPRNALPIVRGQLSFDDDAGQTRYSPDGMTWRYADFSVPAPHIEIIRQDGTDLELIDGGAMQRPTQTAVICRARSLPSEFSNNPALDAKLELYTYRPRNHNGSGKGRMRAAKWTHPVSVFEGRTEDLLRVDAGLLTQVSRERGGYPAVVDSFSDRTRVTSWKAAGLAENAVVMPEFQANRFFKKMQVESNTGAGNSISTAYGVASSGRMNRALRGKNYGSNYNNGQLNLYFAFAYSWVDGDSPDPRKRIVGPFSRVICATNTPFPAFRFGPGDERQTRDSESLTYRFV